MNNSFKEERHGNLLLFDVTKSQDYLVASDVFMIHAFHVASDVLVVCKWKVSEGTLAIHDVAFQCIGNETKDWGRSRWLTMAS